VIVRKIIKMVPPDLKLKSINIDFGWGPQPPLGAFTALPRPPSGI